MSVQQEKFKEIADAIREKTNSEGLIKPSEFAGKVGDVYEAGKQDEHFRAWDFITDKNTKTIFSNQFSRCLVDKDFFRPPYTLKIITGTQMFYLFNCFYDEDGTKRIDIQALEEELGYPIFDTSEMTLAQYMFSSSAFKTLGVIDLSSCTNCYYTFYAQNGNPRGIRNIKKVIFSEMSTNFNNLFGFQYALEHCLFEGVINESIDVSYSTLLDRESLLSLIDCLADKTADTSGTVWKATLGSENVAKLTETELDEIGAKGWTYA